MRAGLLLNQSRSGRATAKRSAGIERKESGVEAIGEIQMCRHFGYRPKLLDDRDEIQGGPSTG